MTNANAEVFLIWFDLCSREKAIKTELRSDWTLGFRVDHSVVLDDSGEVIAEVRGKRHSDVSAALSIFCGIKESAKRLDIDGPCDEDLFHVLEEGKQIASCGSRQSAERVLQALSMANANAEIGRHLSETLLRCMHLEAELESVKGSLLRERHQHQLPFSYVD